MERRWSGLGTRTARGAAMWRALVLTGASMPLAAHAVEAARATQATPTDLAPSNVAAEDGGIAAAVQAIRTHAAERRLVLLGESHGTRETPDLVQALAAAESVERPVLLALEIPHGEQRALDAYMRSDGAAVAREALRARVLAAS